MMDGGGMGMMGGVVVLWVLLLTALIALAVTALIWLVRNMSRSDSRSSTPSRSELDRRYAAGEIDRDQYRQARQDLEG
jgi:putative membrane protein